MAYVIDHGRGERSSPTPQAEVVYLTTVLSQMNDPLYEHALRKVREHHPHAAILPAKTLWANREGWLASYRAVFSGVTHVYIVPSVERTVGQGIVLELAYFQGLDPIPKLFGVFSRKLKFEEISALDFVVPPTPQNFARLVSKSCARAEAKAKLGSRRRHAIGPGAPPRKDLDREWGNHRGLSIG